MRRVPGPAAVPATRPTFLRNPSQPSWTLLLGVALVLLAIGIGLRDPWPPDEPRFALIAQEMLRTGEFWFPRRAAELYPDKPPVFVWLSAMAIAASGSVRLGFLLPSLFAALGTLWLVGDLVRRLYGNRTALMAVAALLTTFQFVLQAKTAQIDMVLTFCTTLGAYGILRHALLGPARGWWLLAWAAVGVGILAKGVGILPLLLLPAWIWLAAKGHVRGLRWKEAGAGFGVLMVVLASWGLPMILMATLGGDAQLAEYRDNILFKQTGQRYVAAWHHLNPWYFYLVEVIPWAWMPLVLTLPWALPAWWRRIRRGDARVILPLAGVVLILIFFSLSPGKRGVYILPAIPLLAIALAPLLPGLWRKAGLQRTGGLLLLGIAGLLLVAGLGGLWGLPLLERLAQRHGVSPWHWWMFLGLTGVLLVAWLRLRRGMLALVVWLAVFWAAWSTWGYALMDGVRSPNQVMQDIARITGPDAWLAMPDFDEEFLLQARQPMVHFGRATPSPAQLARAFAWLQQTPGSRWMLIEQNRKPDLECARLDQARDIGYQNGDYWWLIPGTAFAACPGDERAAPLFVAPTTLGRSNRIPGTAP
jgi:4-amino-4-deoxy-L-arabinose transferase-like glycosyltransferase